MTTTDDPTSTSAPSPRRRRRWPSVLLGVLSLLLLGFGMWLMTDSHDCCAIDCNAYPEVCVQRAREHRRQQERERNIALAAFAGSAAALGYAAVRLGPRAPST